MKLEINGIAEVQKVLEDIAPKHARNLGRSTTHAIAREAAKGTKKSIRSRGLKKTGNLLKSVKAKRKKSPPYQPVSDVVFTQGKSAKNDGFYWRFLEHGTIKMPAQNFVRAVRLYFRENWKQLFGEKFKVQLAKKIKSELKKRRKK